MDVLIPDPTSAAGARIAAELSSRGHRVHPCRHEGQESACAVLADRSCPLDVAPIDVAVWVASASSGTQRGDGATCATTRRVPLVLVDPEPSDPLVAHAAASTDETRAAQVVEQVASSPLSSHTAVAASVLEQELAREGVHDRHASVEVRRREGCLDVRMLHGPALSREQAHRISTHVVQTLREYDHWARGLDVAVQEVGARAEA